MPSDRVTVSPDEEAESRSAEPTDRTDESRRDDHPIERVSDARAFETAILGSTTASDGTRFRTPRETRSASALGQSSTRSERRTWN